MGSTSTLISAITVGLGIGLVGLWLFRPRVSLLERRLEALLADDAAPRNGRMTRSSLLQVMGRRLGVILGGSEHVRARLERAGRAPDVEAFRTSQALWAMGGFVVAAVVVALSGVSSRTNPLSAGGLVVLATLTGVVLRDQALSREATRREARMLAEFPAVADMLALAVAAGQGPLGALENVTALCRGPLSQELGRALSEAHSGTPLSDALAGVGRRTSVLGITRFVEGIIVALDRGTPLADVLRAQAQDAREAARGELIEQAGRKEVLMMVPVVFLVLPITILFAVFPGLSALDLSL